MQYRGLLRRRYVQMPHTDIRWNKAAQMERSKNRVGDILGVGSLKLSCASFRGNLWFREGENSKGVLPVPWTRRSHATAECECISAAF